MSSDLASCPINRARNGIPLNVIAITIVTILSVTTIVLLIVLIASLNRKKNALESPEPPSERHRFRDPVSEVYSYDNSEVHPAWLASYSSPLTGDSWQGQRFLATLFPPALSALETANAREKRLDLVRQSILSNSQRFDWSTFDENRSLKKQITDSQRKQKNLESEKERVENNWPLWL